MPQPHADGGENAFVVLADDDGVLAARTHRHGAEVLVTHPSGRPLIVGVLCDDDLRTFRSRHGVVALIGFCPLAEARLEALLRDVTDVRQLDRVVPALPGSHHVVASLGGRIRAQGTISNTRRMFTGGGVAANRADLVAEIAAAELDEESAALRLLFPSVPHPLTSSTMWRGVTAVAPGHYAAPGGTPDVVRWWTPPAPSLTLAEGADRLRDALVEAVGDSARSRPTISCDLSGGMDSTPVGFLAWQHNPELLAVTMTGLTSEDDDTAIAVDAAARMPRAEHLLMPASDLPLPFEGLFDPLQPHDEPFLGLQGARFTEIARRVRARGSTLHFTGHGGDEVLSAPPNYVHGLARRDPLLALDHVRGHRGLKRWSVSQTWQALRDRQSYRDWLAQGARQVASPLPGARLPPASWNHPLRLPTWLTEAGTRLVVDALDRAAVDAEPLAENRSEHLALEQIRASGRVARLIGQLTATQGVRTAAPFLDDRVVEACLSVLPHERSTPWAFKPLLTAALRDVVPAGIVRRSTKNDMSEDVHSGLRAQRSRLAALCDDLLLADLGLVDAEALRLAVLGPPPPGPALPIMVMTFNCETWLRGASAVAMRSAS
ncbi:asparagine synthase-related protein [Lentzea sp. DG1S-22]|uniref:asparagine synthase-related protein n=1 Tax=Lentzea sp. DG1S-22 TaxID=3108822 RepID=UPI002E78E68B|nr:asparagine synthase-related protein [Lentzea sp. DG1S-22]WVH77665.1 asparagine synthase-related protein [Lentzea sp. DG1S-22]